MNRSDWIEVFQKTLRTHRQQPPTVDKNITIIEAMIAVVASLYAATNKIHPNHIERIANAALDALHDEAELINTSN